MLARHHPRLRIDPERSLVIAGPDQRIVMAGGGTAHLDLCMYLIAAMPAWRRRRTSPGPT